jgi:hypothetical protein
MHRPLFAILLTTVTLTLAGPFQTASAQGQPPINNGTPQATDGRLWGAVIYATAEPDPIPDHREESQNIIPDLPLKLAKVFPQKHFQIVGQHTQDVFRQYDSWVVPSSDLFLKVDSKGPAEKGGVNLHLQFWKQDQVVLKTDALLRPHSPLFIGGPKWRQGQLIFVLQLLD